MVRDHRWRPAVVLFAFVGLIWLATTLGLSQVKSQKRVTALQLGDAAEGARVTIVSDSALNDYEAFRRGDRFYVKIPLAEFAAASPNFRGNGFEDVRVQKVGDSVIVSFKLLPGATARVDQRSNRLDVIFSAAGMGRTVPSVNAVKSYPTSRNRRNATDSEANAGPVPSMSGSSSAASRTNEYYGPSPDDSAGVYRETPRGSRSGRRNSAQTSSGQTSKGNAAAGNLPSQTNAPSPTSTAAPVAASSPFSTPAASTASTASTTSATPITTPVASGSQYPYGVPVSAGQQSAEGTTWDSRIKFAKAWARLNRNALIVGGLVALALLAALVLRSRRKGSGAATAKSSPKDLNKPAAKAVDPPVVAKAPVATPVVAAIPAAATTPAPAPVVATAPAPAPAAPPRVVSTPTPRKEVRSPQPAQAGFAAAAVREPSEADPDREVFEL